MSSSVIKIVSISMCLILSLGSTTSFAKAYYKWVDAKGSTHYTTTPPPKSAKKKGKVDTYGWKNTPAPSTSVQQPNSASEQTTKNTEKSLQAPQADVNIPETPLPTAASTDKADYPASTVQLPTEK